MRSQRGTAFLFFLIRLQSSSAESSASPAPPNACSVTPPMLHAAIPVEAVTATASFVFAYFFFRAMIISRSRTDFPVPAEPVKKTLSPSWTTSCRTLFCSLLSRIF